MNRTYFSCRNLLVLFSFLQLAPASGQELTNKGSALTIRTGTTVTVKGSISSSNTAIIANAGTLQASADFLHDGTLSYTGSGTLELNGNGAQSFTATPLYNLSISGSGAKTPSASFTVTQNLTFSAGTLVTTSTSPVILGPSGTLSESPTAYVDGWIQTTRTLARGDAHNFGGLGLTLTARGAAPGLTTLLRRTGTVAGQAGAAHGNISRIYTVTPANNTGLNADVVFAYRDGELNVQDEATLILLGSTDGGNTWNWLGQEARDATGNTVTLSGINTLGLLTLGSASAPLPLTWLSFTGETGITDNLLHWATASEQNTDHFEVERSADGRTFSAQGRVAAAGNSTTDRQYSYRDAANATYFYRIRQVDRDGHSGYSATIRLSRVEGAAVVTAFPNPFGDRLTLRFPAAFSRVTRFTIRCYDVQGRLLQSGEASLDAGQRQMPLSGFARAGMGTVYLLVNADSGEQFQLRLEHVLF